MEEYTHTFKRQYFKAYSDALDKLGWNKEKAQATFKIIATGKGTISVDGVEYNHAALVAKNTAYDRNKRLITIIDNAMRYQGIGMSLLSHAGTTIKPNTSEEWNKLLTKILGRSPVAFYRHFSRLLWKEVVGDCDEYVNILARRYRGKVAPFMVPLIKECKPLLDQAKADGLHHLMPIILATKMSPKEAKKALGKGNWKKVCSQSFTRNLLIMKAVVTSGNPVVEVAIHTPSSLLKRGKIVDEDIAKLLKNNKVVTKRREADRVVMYAQYLRRHNIAVNPEWTIDRLREEHDNVSHAFRRRELTERMSKETIIATEGFPSSLSDAAGMYTATLLRSPYDLHVEGEEMRHCVGGYHKSVADGHCLIYSISDAKTGKKVSTLEVRIRKLAGDFKHQDIAVFGSESKASPASVKTVYTAGQHYGKANSLISNEVESFGKWVVSELNKIEGGKQ